VKPAGFSGIKRGNICKTKDKKKEFAKNRMN
jgi:hypothetical protein